MKINKIAGLSQAERVVNELQKVEGVDHVEVFQGVFINPREWREEGYRLMVFHKTDHEHSVDLHFFIAEYKSSDDIIVYTIKQVDGKPYRKDFKFTDGKHFKFGTDEAVKEAAEYILQVIFETYPKPKQ